MTAVFFHVVIHAASITYICGHSIHSAQIFAFPADLLFEVIDLQCAHLFPSWIAQPLRPFYQFMAPTHVLLSGDSSDSRCPLVPFKDCDILVWYTKAPVSNSPGSVWCIPAPLLFDIVQLLFQFREIVISLRKIIKTRPTSSWLPFPDRIPYDALVVV